MLETEKWLARNYVSFFANIPNITFMSWLPKRNHRRNSGPSGSRRHSSLSFGQARGKTHGQGNAGQKLAPGQGCLLPKKVCLTTSHNCPKTWKFVYTYRDSCTEKSRKSVLARFSKFSRYVKKRLIHKCRNLNPVGGSCPWLHNWKASGDQSNLDSIKFRTWHMVRYRLKHVAGVLSWQNNSSSSMQSFSFRKLFFVNNTLNSNNSPLFTSLSSSLAQLRKIVRAIFPVPVKMRRPRFWSMIFSWRGAANNIWIIRLEIFCDEKDQIEHTLSYYLKPLTSFAHLLIGRYGPTQGPFHHSRGSPLLRSRSYCHLPLQIMPIPTVPSDTTCSLPPRLPGFSFPRI
jgi:hypothetical protein